MKGVREWDKIHLLAYITTREILDKTYSKQVACSSSANRAMLQ